MAGCWSNTLAARVSWCAVTKGNQLAQTSLHPPQPGRLEMQDKAPPELLFPRAGNCPTHPTPHGPLAILGGPASAFRVTCPLPVCVQISSYHKERADQGPAW